MLQGPKAPWVHTDEGDDDMPAHVKSSVFGASLTIPITSGRLALGTWQGGQTETERAYNDQAGEQQDALPGQQCSTAGSEKHGCSTAL